MPPCTNTFISMGKSEDYFPFIHSVLDFGIIIWGLWDIGQKHRSKTCVLYVDAIKDRKEATDAVVMYHNFHFL